MYISKLLARVKAAQLWLLLFILLLNLPNLLWTNPGQVILLNGAEYLSRLSLSLLLAACGMALFARVERAWLVLWLLFLCWQPLAVAVRSITAAPINASLIGTAFATSPGELQGLFSSLPLLWLLYFITWNLACFCLWRWLKRRQLPRWSWPFRGKVLLFSLSMLALPHLILPGSSAMQATTASDNPLEQLKQAEQTPGAGSYLAEAFPYELPIALHQYLKSRRIIQDIRSSLKLAPPPFHIQTDQHAAEVVVLVIGESSTRNAWQLFNPEAPNTTPYLLKRRQNGEPLYAFEQTVAQATATLLAVPSILTQQPLLWPNGQTNPNATLSIISTAAAAGYATAWFSNQTAAGRHDGIIAAYAEEAASKAFLNPAHFSSQGNYDNALLEPLKRHVRNQERSLVVLHTMGSHFHYAHRYPAGFGPFPQSNDAREAYYNSIAYTDWVLEQIIRELEQDGRRAVLLYISDHGESIPQDTCNADIANRYSRDAFEIPALVWLSRSYAQAYPEISKQLAANTAHDYSAAAVPQTLLDLIHGHGDSQLPDQHTQSFARTSAIAPTWPATVRQAIDRNSCAIFIKPEGK